MLARWGVGLAPIGAAAILSAVAHLPLEQAMGGVVLVRAATRLGLRLGRQAIAEISGRERLPIVCGGTGFYLRALVDGLFEGPTRDEELRGRLAQREETRPGSLHRLLRRLDAATAAKNTYSTRCTTWPP